MKKNKKVFLGGTCNESTWRDELIKKLKIDYFNPVVDNWNEEAQKKEKNQRINASFTLFVITPLMKGVFSIAEVIDCSNKRPESTLFCVLEKDGDKEFEDFQIKSLNQVKEMVKDNGGNVFKNLDEISEFLNGNKDLKESIDRMQKLAGLNG